MTLETRRSRKAELDIELMDCHSHGTQLSSSPFKSHPSPQRNEADTIKHLLSRPKRLLDTPPLLPLKNGVIPRCQILQMEEMQSDCGDDKPVPSIPSLGKIRPMGMEAMLI